MAGRIKQYPSKRQLKKGVRAPTTPGAHAAELGPGPWETKRTVEKGLGRKIVRGKLGKEMKTRPTHDPMKELNKAMRGGGGGGGFGGGRWTKDKMGRRHLKIM